MRRIINGKKYDTETAEEVGYASSGGSKCDFSYWEETLFKKKTGEFFLSGEGHGFTRWACSCGNMSGYGHGLEPISLEEATEWGERHLSGEKYEDVFGQVEE